ncbi:hypothetical protein HID58_077144, partial [Brassica napus]
RETRESSSSFTPPLSLRISSPWLRRSVLLPFDLDGGGSVKSTIPSEKTIAAAQKFHSHHSILSGAVPIIGNKTHRFPNNEAASGYRCLSLRGFVLNWLPGPEVDLMIKNRLRLLYAVAKRNPISFGHLVYDQVIEMTRLTDLDTNLVFPNLIYQLLMLQHEVPLLPGDEEAIGRGFPIHGFAGDTSGPRGHRRLN